MSRQVSRKGFLKTAGLAAAGVGAAAMGFGGAARAIPPPMEDGKVVVYPVGDPMIYPDGHPNHYTYPNFMLGQMPCTQDMAELFAAFNGGVGPSGVDYGAGGGPVLLKATNLQGAPTNFELGLFPYAQWFLRGWLTLSKDVGIYGETVNGNMTTLHGGFSLLYTIAPIALHVEGIHFRRSMASAITPINCTGCTIKWNKVTEVDASVARAGAPEANGFYLAAMQLMPGYGELTGAYTIEDNIIELNPNYIGLGIVVGDLYNGQDIESDYGTFPGVPLTDIQSLSIKRNTITGATYKGIWVQSLNSLVYHADPPLPAPLPPKTVAYVEENTVECAAPRKEWYEYTVYGSGINTEQPADILNNNITCASPRGSGVAIRFLKYTDDPVTDVHVEGNTIHMIEGASGAVNLIGDYHTCKGNTISGHYTFWPAVWVGANRIDGGTVVEDNDYTGTDLKGFLVSTDGPARPGCVYLSAYSFGNTVSESLDNFPVIPGSDPCTQVADGAAGYSPASYPANFPQIPNVINGFENCASKKYERMIESLEKAFLHLEKMDSLKNPLFVSSFPYGSNEAFQCYVSGGRWRLRLVFLPYPPWFSAEVFCECSEGKTWDGKKCV